MTPKILLVGFSKRDSKFFEKTLLSVDLKCESAADLDGALEKIPKEPPALVVVEEPPNPEVLRSLQHVLKGTAPAASFLVALKKHSAQKALEILQAGAYDCLSRPLDPLQILAASKRAALRQGRTLFVKKLAPERRRSWPLILGLLMTIGLVAVLNRRLNGPPPNSLSLGSAHLSGIQWENRSLWVGNWYESTVTNYEAKRGLIQKSRDLMTREIFHMQDGQPVLVCNTPEALVTVGADLKIRSHQRAVGLPTLNTVQAPGQNPTGLAWDGQNIWSSDGQTGLLYRHGMDLKVLETVKSIFPQPLGLAAEASCLWVVGGTPLRLAKLEYSTEKGAVWHGPYLLSNVFQEGVIPAGLAVGHGRVWFVSGGDPRMISCGLDEVMEKLIEWNPPKKKGKS